MNVLVAMDVLSNPLTCSPAANVDVPVPPTSNVLDACNGAPVTINPLLNVLEALAINPLCSVASPVVVNVDSSVVAPSTNSVLEANSVLVWRFDENVELACEMSPSVNTASSLAIRLFTLTAPSVAPVAKRLVLEAVVAKLFVLVAFVVVALVEIKLVSPSAVVICGIVVVANQFASVSTFAVNAKSGSRYAARMVELEVNPPAPSPNRNPVGVVLPVPPRFTANVPCVSLSLISNVEVAVSTHVVPLNVITFPNVTPVVSTSDRSVNAVSAALVIQFPLASS